MSRWGSWGARRGGTRSDLGRGWRLGRGLAWSVPAVGAKQGWRRDRGVVGSCRGGCVSGGPLPHVVRAGWGALSNAGRGDGVLASVAVLGRRSWNIGACEAPHDRLKWVHVIADGDRTGSVAVGSAHLVFSKASRGSGWCHRGARMIERRARAVSAVLGLA